MFLRHATGRELGEMSVPWALRQERTNEVEGEMSLCCLAVRWIVGILRTTGGTDGSYSQVCSYAQLNPLPIMVHILGFCFLSASVSDQDSLIPDPDQDLDPAFRLNTNLDSIPVPGPEPGF